jgi:hypothetical protein
MIVGFKQDPSAEPGWGDFTNDKGQTLYTFDPATASQFAAESNAIASSAVPSAAQALVDRHLSLVASNEGATGSAATGQPAPATNPAQALVDKHVAITTPAPRADGLVKTGTSYGRQTQQGRSLANVNAQIGAEEKAGTSNDQTILDTARAADDRATGVVTERMQGVQAGAGQAVNQGFEAKRVQQEVAQQVGQLREELKQNDESFDPDRLMRNMSTGKSVLMTILAAISGAFGAVLGNKDNAFMSVIDKKVAQDIDKQKGEIASGRVRIGNMIAELQQKGYDAKTAERLATDRLNAGVDKMIELQAQRQGLSGAQLDAAKALVGQRQEARAARRGDLLAQTEARVVESNQTTFERPKPTTLSIDDIYKQGQIKQQQLEEMDAAEVANVINDGKSVSVKRANEAIKGAQDLAVKVPRVEVAEQQLRNVLKEAGVPAEAYNPETGTIDWTKVSDLKGVGPLDSRPSLKAGPFALQAKGAEAIGLTQSDNSKLVDAAVPLREALTFLTTGAVASPTQVEGFKKQAGEETANEDAFKRNLSDTARQIATQKNSMFSGSEDARKLYQHNLNRGSVTSLRPGVN